MNEDTQALVPVVLSGAQPSTNVSLRMTVDYGRLLLAGEDDTDDIKAIVEAGEYLTLPGSHNEVNEALKGVWYAPPADWNSPGKGTFETLTVVPDEYDAAQGGVVNTGYRHTLIVRVVPINDGPSLQSPSEVTALERVTTILSGIEVYDVDSHEARGVVEVTVSVAQPGSLLELGTELGLYVTQSLPESKTFLGSVKSVNAALAGLTYRGAQEFSGRDELTINVDDRGNTGEGGALNASATVSIFVSSVNNPPQVMRADGLLLTGVEDEVVVLAGITLADEDAAGANMRITLEARHGAVSMNTESVGLDFIEGNGLRDSRVVIDGTIEVRWTTKTG